MSYIRTLVVDDSILSREMISAILSTDGQIHVAGQAGNGREAVRQVAVLHPDMVIMDIEMPVMNGFEAIEEIMAAHPVPILVVSSMDDAGTAYRAISLGALEVLSKSEIDVERPENLVDKVKYLSRVKVISHIRGGAKGKDLKDLKDVRDVRDLMVLKGLRELKELRDHLEPRALATASRRQSGAWGREPEDYLKPAAALDNSRGIVAIAASTGGPKAFSVILPALPADFPWPIVIAQHMAIGFASGMVEWLNKISGLLVKVAEEKEPVTAGVVYITPPERHLTIGRDKKFSLGEARPAEIYHPSCDALLLSVAEVYGPKAVGIILTGMGSDGVEGMKKVKAAGGVTIAQDEATCVVFGMPGVAIRSNCIDRVLPLDDMAGEIIHMARKARARG